MGEHRDVPDRSKACGKPAQNLKLALTWKTALTMA